jgi:hypothetical protein
VFEKSAVAGSFFDTYPRHRKLISINKRFTGRSDPNFNMRHDWNSLLHANDSVSPVTQRCEDRFPHADVLANYLRDYAVEQVIAGRIEFSTTVKKIRKDKAGNFSMHLETFGKSKEVTCHAVIMATGLQKPITLPNLPPDLVDSYQAAPAPGQETRERFTNRSVLIFGLGNAAFETANAVMKYAQYVHLFPGRKPGPDAHPKLAWELRYPGGVRAANAEVFDAYLLKSLDGGFADYSTPGDTLRVFRCGKNKEQRCLVQVEGRTEDLVFAGNYPTQGDNLWTGYARAEKFFRSIKEYIVSDESFHDDKTSPGLKRDIESGTNLSLMSRCSVVLPPHQLPQGCQIPTLGLPARKMWHLCLCRRHQIQML